MKINNDLTIQFATINNLPSIVAIYNQAIRSSSATGDTEEFSVEERINWFHKFNNNSYPLYIAKINNEIVGYCALSAYRPGRKAMSKVAEISYYVDYNFHKKGIGTSLLKHVIEDCGRLEKDNLLAFILDSNTSTINILKKFKFKQLGYLPNIIEINSKKCGHLIYGLNTVTL
ncbi:N-acetyltransferase family protein [Lutibacter sp.]